MWGTILVISFDPQKRDLYSIFENKEMKAQ